MSTIAIPTRKYPFFDLAEIVSDIDLPFRKYQPLKPVQAGNYLPDLSLKPGYENWQYFFNGAETYGTIQLRNLLNKPLVLHFYSAQWRDHGLDQLKQLNNLQSEIKAAGGNLVVITDEKATALEKLVWDNNLSLNFYFDPKHVIAETLRIYSDADPVWNKFSGIDANVPLLSTYVLDMQKQVVFSQVSLNVTELVEGKQLLNTVYAAGLTEGLRRSA